MTSRPKVSLLGLSCCEASRLLSESMDRELSRRERWSLRFHTIVCSACRRFARQCGWIRDVVSQAPDAVREQLAAGAMGLSAERRLQIKRLLTDAQRAEGRLGIELISMSESRQQSLLDQILRELAAGHPPRGVAQQRVAVAVDPVGRFAELCRHFLR